MAEIGGKWFRVRSVLNNKVARLGQLALLVMIAYISFQKLSTVFSPTHVNHLIIVNFSGRVYRSPITVQHEGDCRWEELIVGGVGSRRGFLGVWDIPHAYSTGRVTIDDAEGEVIADFQISPPGRYPGSLVLVLLPEQKNKHAFNHLPEGIPLHHK